jgi:putative membrane protein
MVAIANVLVFLIALEHFWFAILEIFLWQRPLGLKAFRQSPEAAAQTAVLAKNQGTYNLFLVAGLLWGFFSGGTDLGLPLKVFFLSCVLIAGLVGGLTVSKRIFWIQATPALLALILILI